MERCTPRELELLRQKRIRYRYPHAHRLSRIPTASFRNTGDLTRWRTAIKRLKCMDNLAVMIVLLMGAWFATAAAPAYEGDCFFGIAWDGVRYDQLDSYTAPHLLGEIKSEGIWLSHLYNAWHTITSPGHANFHTGTPNLHPNTWDYWYLPHYYPSLMESYLKEHGLSGEDTTWAWVFGNCPNDTDWGSSLHPSYGETFRASHGFTLRMSDTFLFDTMILPTLETYHPAIFWVDFHEVDYKGHRIKTPEDSLEYREAIRRADSLLALLFEYIDTSTVYSGKTNVLIVTDHGRHSEGIQTGLKDHGCDCDGCRHVFGCLWGPDFKDNVVDDAIYYQTDIASAIAHVMGLRAPHTRSRTLVDSWIANYVPEEPWPYNPSGGERISESELPCSSPDLSRSSNGLVHTIWCENQRDVVYRRKDGGEWHAPIVIATAADDELLREPRIACYDSTVTALWQRYRTNNHGFHSWYLETAHSDDGGHTWMWIATNVFEDAAVITSDVIVGLDDISTYSLVGGIYTAFEGGRDSLGLVSIRKSYEPWVWSEQGRYPDNATYQGNYIDLERFGSKCAVVCQAYDYLDQNSEIIATISSDHGKQWRTRWISISRDGEGSPYAHQYFPSVLIVDHE
jgi:hypothetical protein